VHLAQSISLSRINILFALVCIFFSLHLVAFNDEKRGMRREPRTRDEKGDRRKIPVDAPAAAHIATINLIRWLQHKGINIARDENSMATTKTMSLAPWHLIKKFFLRHPRTVGMLSYRRQS
jgi:hypothetical protein